MTDNYGEHQCTECGAPLSVAGLCHRCKALNSCSAHERLKAIFHDPDDLMQMQEEESNEDS